MKNSLILIVIFSTLSIHCARKSMPVSTIPIAIQNKIDALKSQPLQNPPAVIYRYDYNGRQVYYLNSPCCDQFSSLLNEKGELICHPDGGITGKGDGKCPDFFSKRTNEVLIWKDERK